MFLQVTGGGNPIACQLFFQIVKGLTPLFILDPGLQLVVVFSP